MNMKRLLVGAVIALAGGLWSAAADPVNASPPQHHGENPSEDEHPGTGVHEEHGVGAHHEGHGGHHPNDIGLFIGATDEHPHGSEFTWGIDYKRRLKTRDDMAIGAFFDHAGGEQRNSLVGALFTWWPIADLQLFGGPAVEFHNGRNQDGGSEGGGHEFKSEGGEHGGSDSNETYFAFRVGAGYDVHLGEHYAIVPTVAVDFVNNEEAWVYGVTLSYGW